MTDTRFSSIDTFGVYSMGDHERNCVAICDSPLRVRHSVRAYQEIYRTKPTKLHLVVDRLPRQAGKRPDPTPCGYCGRTHWGTCTCDHLGEPSAFEDGTPLPLPSEA